MNYPNRIKGWFRLSYQLIIIRFKILKFSRRTVRDKALLALTTNQKTRCLLQTYIRFHCQLLVRVRVALKSDYDPISTRSSAGI